MQSIKQAHFCEPIVFLKWCADDTSCRTSYILIRKKIIDQIYPNCGLVKRENYRPNSIMLNQIMHM